MTNWKQLYLAKPSFKLSGEWAIKLKNNVLNLVRFLPKWKILMYILISFFLAVMTGIILLLALLYIRGKFKIV